MPAPRLRFHGATRTVTGSCFALETSKAHILVDCGMFQGSKSEKELNYRAFPFRAPAVDAMILTHAHIDHSGLIPKLVKAGFAGPIITTRPTMDLCSVMLPDSGHIQELEVEQLNRRNARRGKREVTPIYTAEDAAACLTQFHPTAYQSWTAVAEGVRARFWNAGHLLGSASVEVEVASDETRAQPIRILFSGDIGPDNKLLHPDPDAPSSFDYVVCESTYGDRARGDLSPDRRRKALCDEVRAAARPDGALLIPSFAVERTQELLVDLVTLMDEGDFQPCQIYIDSPLATKASAIFKRHARELDEGSALIRALESHRVHFTESVEQSKALDRMRDFHIVIAASGMCEAGRIRHRLKNWLWREEGTVLLVGFQAQGTLGRILLDGASAVRIQGDDIKVRARIRSLDLYSGHADAAGLTQWVKERLPIAHNLFLTHGEEAGIEGFRTELSSIMDPEVIIAPSLDAAYELTPQGARAAEMHRPRRVAEASLGHLDWHNELSKLLLDINERVDQAADERARAVVIRRLRRALEGA